MSVAGDILNMMSGGEGGGGSIPTIGDIAVDEIYVNGEDVE